MVKAKAISFLGLLAQAALLLALFAGSTPFASTTWPNEPAGSAQLLDWNFDRVADGVWPGMKDIYSSGRIVSDATAPLSPSNVMKSTIAAGANSGGVQLDWIAPGQYKEMYVGLWWRTNPEFEGRTVANKMFFVRGPSTNGFFGIFAPPKSKTMTFYFGHNSGNLDNSHTCALDLGLQCNPNVGSSTVTIGEWTRLEVYMKGSTTTTSRDGIVRWWVNGQLGGNYTNFNYSTTLNEWVWSETWDGYVNPVPSVEWAHFVDHLHISAPNCGPSGCAAPAYLVITSTLPSARTGTPYSATLTANGGTKPYTWFKESGNLPAGLTLNQSTGVISGTPTCVGRSDFTIRATDASQPAVTTTRSYSIITSGTSTSCPTISITGSPIETEKTQFTAKTIGGKVAFDLPVTSGAQYRLSVYDLGGKKVYEHSSLGQREISIAKTLKSGVYLARFVQGAQVSAHRFSVIE